MPRYSVDGLWWVPGRHENKVAGKLFETERGGLRLELLGSLSENRSLMMINSEENYAIVHGFNEKGKPATLLSCSRSGSRITLPAGVTQEYYSVRMALIGAFLDDKALTFHQASMSFGHLSNWLSRPVFLQGDPSSFDASSYHYRRPPDIEARIRGGSLRIGSTYESKNDYFNELNLAYTPIIQITTDEPLGLDAWEERFLRPLRDFLTFATRHVVHLSHLEFSCKGSLNASGKPSEVEVVLPNSGDRAAPVEYLHPHELLFGAQDVGEHLGEILARWLDRYQELDNVMSLFFAPIYNEHMYLEHQFLNLAYATETYHRLRYPGGMWSKSDFETIREKAIGQFEGGKRKWMKARLRHANEPSFRDRIFSLLSLYEEPLKLFPIAAQQFAEKVADTRNYYVHFDDSLRGRQAQGEALFRMLQVLQSLIEVCLLSELGFNSQEVTALVERNENLKFTARMIQKNPGLFE